MAGSNGLAVPAAYPPPVDSPEEFIKRELDAEDGRIEVGVAIVGGGTAGLASANRLLQLLAEDAEAGGDLMERLGEVPVAVIEKAKTCGGHNLSGAVMRPEPLQELEAWLAPFRRLWSAHVDALERHLARVDPPKRAKAKPRAKSKPRRSR